MSQDNLIQMPHRRLGAYFMQELRQLASMCNNHWSGMGRHHCRIDQGGCKVFRGVACDVIEAWGLNPARPHPPEPTPLPKPKKRTPGESWPRRCRTCRTLFPRGSNRQSLCPACGRKHRKEKLRQYGKARLNRRLQHGDPALTASFPA